MADELGEAYHLFMAVSSAPLHDILQTHPKARVLPIDLMASVGVALRDCQLVCAACADACLSESDGALADCVRINLACACICDVSAQLILDTSEEIGPMLHAQLHACVLACQHCADICSTHAHMHEHCARCAQVCRHCQEECNRALGTLSSASVISDT